MLILLIASACAIPLLSIPPPQSLPSHLNRLSSIPFTNFYRKPSLTRKERPTVITSVVGGSDTHARPYMALLRTGFNLDPDGGGVLIAKNMILTCAHIPTQQIFGAQASTYRKDMTQFVHGEKGVGFKVLEVIRHPKYSKGSSNYDLAIWIVQENQNSMSKPLSFVKLPWAVTDTVDDLRNLKVLGWGATSRDPTVGRTSNILQEIHLELCDANERDIQKYYGGSSLNLLATMHEDGESGPASGDSAERDDGTNVLYGIVSTCTVVNLPVDSPRHYYTNVEFNRKWIESVIADHP